MIDTPKTLPSALLERLVEQIDPHRASDRAIQQARLGAGRQLALRRLALGYTHQQLAARAGMPVAGLQMIEMGLATPDDVEEDACARLALALCHDPSQEYDLRELALQSSGRPLLASDRPQRAASRWWLASPGVVRPLRTLLSPGAHPSNAAALDGWAPAGLALGLALGVLLLVLLCLTNRAGLRPVAQIAGAPAVPAVTELPPDRFGRLRALPFRPELMVEWGLIWEPQGALRPPWIGRRRWPAGAGGATVALAPWDDMRLALPRHELRAVWRPQRGQIPHARLVRPAD